MECPKTMCPLSVDSPWGVDGQSQPTDFSGTPHGWTMDIPRTVRRHPKDCLWTPHKLSNDCPRTVHVWRRASHRLSIRLFLDCLRTVDGLSTDSRLIVYGHPMDCPWTPHGLFTHTLRTVCPWTVGGVCMGCPSSGHGQSAWRPWRVRGMSVDCSWMPHGRLTDCSVNGPHPAGRPWASHGHPMHTTPAVH